MANGLLAQPISALGGFQQSQELAERGARRNALTEVAGAVNTGDFATAGKAAAGIGDVELVGQIRSLVKAGEQEKLNKVKQAGVDLTNIVARFDSIPQDQLPAAIQAQMPTLQQMFPDVDPRQIVQNAMDPNARRAAVAQAQSLTQLIDREESAAKLNVEQQKVDVSGARLTETQRSNRSGETIKLKEINDKIDARVAKAATKEAASNIRRQGAISQLQDTKGVVTRLLSHPGLSSAVGINSKLPTIPGSEKADFEAITETLQARLGFDELARMRASSPTGGALGQISERELSFLQAAVQSLDASQSEVQFKENLNLIFASLERFEAVQQQAVQGGGDLSTMSDEELQTIAEGG